MSKELSVRDKFLKIGMAQIAPVWLNKKLTINKIISVIIEAKEKGVDLLVFGEGFLPGYPFWLSFTHASEFDSKIQKEVHAHYLREAVDLEAGDLDSICSIAKESSIAIYLGIIERPKDRGGHSIYASLVYIDKNGVIKSCHRKLQPTYEERLSWASGDGHGLCVHELDNFRVGGLNCWENWMPLARAALYGQGENLHIAVWPGSVRNTEDITRFIAKESRSFVVSVSSLMSYKDIDHLVPHRELMIAKSENIWANGGSCIASPDGKWHVEPIADVEGLFISELDYNLVFEERQNFDPAGHYSRPDVTKLYVNRERQSTIKIID
jgi:nitrilase